jgi:hypothetical protein
MEGNGPCGLALRKRVRSVCLEAVMNSIKNGLGMRKAGDRGGSGQAENPHFNTVFTQVHNTVNTLCAVAGDASDRPDSP